MDKDTTHFANRKLHSLLGVLPLGGFILEHLFTNGFILGGQNSYDRQVNWLLSLPKPILWSLELLLIAFPLLFHSIYGVKVALDSKSNTKNYPYGRNFAYWLQRVTAMYLLVFIIYHVWTTRFAGHFEYPAVGPAIDAAGRSIATAAVSDSVAMVQSKSSIYYFMLDHMSGNWLLGVVYLLGVAAAAFHFANGLWTFCISWGITVGARAQRVSLVLFYILGAALLAIGTATVLHLVLTPNPFKV
jgi:succinate dehydrogenase / fumarate reductase, cytochrome b subunit